ncbi:hypothetical protein RAF57_27585, partial [Klebsiella pneumoniae]
KHAYCLKTQPATGETYPKSDLFNKANIIVKAVAENSLNPQDIEKVVKTSLLPLLFTACREIGAGMNQVNRIVETIIQILRVGLMKS